jgi:hypothetical protein
MISESSWRWEGLVSTFRFNGNYDLVFGCLVGIDLACRSRRGRSAVRGTGVKVLTAPCRGGGSS